MHACISSSGLLDFHLKKLNDLITTNDEGNYTLTEKGFAALTAVEGAGGYYRLRSAQKRSFFLALAVMCLLTLARFGLHFKLKTT